MVGASSHRWSRRLQTGKSGGGCNVGMDHCLRHQYELMSCLVQMQMVTYRSIYRYVYTELVYIHIFPSCQLKAQKQQTSVTRSTPNTKILVTSTLLQWKEPEFLREMADSKAENICESGDSCTARVRKCSKNIHKYINSTMGICQRDTRYQLKEVPTGKVRLLWATE